MFASWSTPPLKPPEYRVPSRRMFDASFHLVIDGPWLRMDPIRIGPVRQDRSTPDAYVTVTLDGRPHTRIDARAAWDGAFREVIVWRSLVLLGWSDTVHLIDPATRQSHSVSCEGYFGHLYPLDTRLLIASASELICLADTCDELWRCKGLGLDGVLVDNVSDGAIHGRGEWDPPGGWRPFRLDYQTGEPHAVLE